MKVSIRTIRAILLFKTGALQKGGGNYVKPTNAQVLKFMEDNPSLPEVINYISKIYRQFRFISHPNLTMLYWVISKKNQEQADDFFEKYATGIDLGLTNPIRHLRERLLNDSISKAKLKSRDKVALFIFAWNAYIEGRKMQKLTLQRDYVFPKPI